MRKILFLLLCAAAAALTNTDANAAPAANDADANGPYAVGLKVVRQYDHARAYRGTVDSVTGQPFKGERSRPMLTLVWYPAQAGGKPMSAAAYLELDAGEDDFALGAAELRERTAATFEQIDASMGAGWKRETLARPMAAVSGARPVAGTFPLVVYAPSHNAAATENADLCEYLASHGYVVVASASRGAHERNVSIDQVGAETQADDIAFLIAYAHTLPQADLRHIAVAGYSWGGLANVIAASRDSRIAALVDLDGSVRYFPELAKSLNYLTPASVAVPLLFVAARPRTIEELNEHHNSTGFSLMNKMRYSDVYVLTMHAMMHPNFSSLYLHYTPDANFKDYSREEVAAASGWTARYVRQFLDAYLKNAPDALAFLRKRPVDNGMAPHAATMAFHLAEGTPATRESLAADLAARGFSHATEAYQAMHKRDPDFQLSEDQLTGWAYQLLREQHDTAAAIEMFKLATVVSPDGWNAWDSLAEAYAQHGDKALAIDNYRHSLRLNPQNDNATRQLEILGAAD
jgi:dienelactone hydrolase